MRKAVAENNERRQRKASHLPGDLRRFFLRTRRNGSLNQYAEEKKNIYIYLDKFPSYRMKKKSLTPKKEQKKINTRKQKSSRNTGERRLPPEKNFSKNIFSWISKQKMAVINYIADFSSFSSLFSCKVNRFINEDRRVIALEKSGENGPGNRSGYRLGERAAPPATQPFSS